jgi:hypothetical protein
MDVITLLLIAIFVPLFPFSIIFNALFERLIHPLWRSILLLVWPLMGIILLQGYQPVLPDWMPFWALGTAILYAFRLLSVREMGLWIGFLATSAWSLLWIGAHEELGSDWLFQSALGFSLPFAILAAFVEHIESRFGAAYTDLQGGLAMTTPRLSGVLVISVLAATATPVFPAFFIMLYIIVSCTPGIVVGMLVAWLLWTWAGARLLQGLIVGPAVGEKIQDIGKGLTWLYALLLVALVLAGISLIGGRL